MITSTIYQSQPPVRRRLTRARLIVVVVCIFLLTGLATTYAHEVVNLVGAYGFSEGARTTTLDASGQSGPGTLLNGASWIPGKYGFGVSFNGTNNFISVPDGPALQLGRTGTVEAWVRLNAGNRWNGVLGKATSTTDAGHNYAVEIDPQNRPICVIGDGAESDQVRSNTALRAGEFYHLACTWDGSQLRLYLNGVLNGSVAQTLTPRGSGGPLVIGQYGGDTRYLSGIIDEVRIFNIAVAQPYIQLNMNTPVETTPDTVPPTVSLAAPGDNSSVSGSIEIVASASDDRVVAGVTFFVDGLQVGPESLVTTYAAAWDTRTVTNGPHTLTAVARDAAGNKTTSTPRTVTVANIPYLSITKPVSGTSVSATSLDITYAIVGDRTGFNVDHVHFEVDGGANVIDLPPADGMKTITGIRPGTHTVTGFLARSDNAKIAGTDSEPVTFTTVAPDGNLTMGSPTNGSALGVPVILSANASGNTGIAAVPSTVDVGGVAQGSGSRVPTAVARAVSTNPAVVGQWSSDMNWPLVAIHMTLMPTGEILMWDGWELPAAAAKVWNPTTNVFYDTPVSAGIFCGAQAVLSDGTVVVVGGHDGPDIGIPDAFTFDPFTRVWTRAPYMNFSRWYPSATRLGDNRVVVVSGQIVDGTWADEPEVFDPSTNLWTVLTGAQTSDSHPDDYPLSFLIPDGTIYTISTDLGESHTLSLSPLSWGGLKTIPVPNGVATMYRPGKILMTGGAKTQGTTSQATAAVIDRTAPSPSWSTVASMAYGRYQHNLVVLADGNVLAVGGSNFVSDTTQVSNGVLPAELFNATTETWTTMAAMTDPRMYHSTALLLPDGSVLSAGGGRWGSIQSYPTAQIFYPPYFFKGSRPTITSAPTVQSLGTTFAIQTPDAATISSVAIVPLGTVTHTLNMNQTYIQLPFTVSGTTLQAQLPVNESIAPPGYYMLFILNNQGVPSIAPFIRVEDPNLALDTTPPTVAITAPSNNQIVAGTVTVSANASDNVGVTSVEFALDGNPLGNSLTTLPYSISWNSALIVDGNHVLTATAHDAAGNETTSTGVTVTVWNNQGPAGRYLGYSVIGQTVDSNDSNSMIATQFVMPNETGTAVSLSVWIEPPVSPAPNNQFQAAIYSDKNGAPSALITTTSSATIVPGAWNTVPISTTLQPNTAYWLAYNTNGTSASANNLRFDAGALYQVQYRSQKFGTFPSSFGAAAPNCGVYASCPGISNTQDSIYVTYLLPGGDTTPPTVSITSPTGGTTVSGTITVNATASDNVGVSSVQFQLDGQALGSLDTTSPYSTSWNTTAAANGTHVLTAVARDAAGNATTSAGISVTVSNSGDTTPPTVSITSPTGGTTVSGTITVNATASDNVGVSSVQFQLDGQALGSLDTTSPYSTSWNTTAAANGTHVLTAVARDAAGNATTSAGISVTVSNSGGSQTATLGYTAIGASVDSGDRNYMNAFRFVMPNQSGTATSLSVYVAGPLSAAPNNQFQVAIYADSGGVPGALLVASASQTLTQNAWNTVALTGALQANAAYWLAYNTNATADTANNVRTDPGTANQQQWRAQTFGTWPATFGTGQGSSATQASIYATYTLAATYGISGTITPAASGSGVTVTLSGAASATTVADGSGNYSFTGLTNGGYTVTPSKSGVTFSPANAAETISGGNVTANFTATAAPTYSISGTITPAASGSGATVTLSGAASATTVADGSGNYSFTGLANGGYTVTPSKSGFTFSPANAAETISGGNVTANFTATAASTYSISGTITPAASGTGATVTLSGAASATTTANSSGVYSFTGLVNGSYTVTPSKSGFTFSPANAAVTISGGNVTANFTATATLGYTAIGASVDSGDRNYMNAFRFVMPNQSGTATSLSVYVAGPLSAAPNNQFQVAIYADSGGVPGALLVASASQTLTQNAWNTVALTGALQANAAYWLAYNTNATADTANNVRTDPGTANQQQWRAQTFGTWPATFGTGQGSSATQASIYVTYTVP